MAEEVDAPILHNSEVLGEEVWIVRVPRQKIAIKDLGDDRTVYYQKELQHLKGMEPKHLRFMHDAKKVFDGIIVGEVEPTPAQSKKIAREQHHRDNRRHG